MLNVFTDRTDFDLGIDDHGLSGDKDINIYVLDEDMRALSLMEAFRSTADLLLHPQDREQLFPLCHRIDQKRYGERVL